MEKQANTYRQSAVLVPYRKLLDGGYEIFMQRRSKNAVRFPNHLGFFGGGINEGETAEKALKREIREELDIDISNYNFLGHLEPSNGSIDVFTLEVADDFENMVKVNEGQYGKFVRFEDTWKDLLSDGAQMILKKFEQVIIKPKKS